MRPTFAQIKVGQYCQFTGSSSSRRTAQKLNKQVRAVQTLGEDLSMQNGNIAAVKKRAPSVPSIAQQEKEFMHQASDLLINYLLKSESGDGKVVDLVDPKQMKEQFRQQGCAIELDDNQKPCQKDVLINAADIVSIVGDWLAAAANTNVHTFEVAPVFTVVEVEVLSKMARVIGGEYAQAHDGLFAPGGSVSNLYGMHLARNQIDPDFKTKGAVGGPEVVAFTSEQSHYSYKKSAALTGLGLNNLIAVECDKKGAMIPEALEAAIQKSKADGKVPFFVGATAGTTVLGAYDPFDAIADICSKHGIWMHIDGCWGGSAIISQKYKHLMSGSNRADSIAWNVHKWLGIPLQCSAFLSKHSNILTKVNSLKADYLFQPDKLNVEYDLGDKTIQCGRRADAYKFWLAWKALGDEGFAQKVEHAFDLALHFEERIKNSGGKFVLAAERSCTNVCFWYVPPSLRPFRPDQTEKWEQISKVAPYLKQKMQESGDAMIGFQPLNGKPNFFRIVFASSFNVTKDDLDAMLQRMDQYGQNL